MTRVALTLLDILVEIESRQDRTDPERSAVEAWIRSQPPEVSFTAGAWQQRFKAANPAAVAIQARAQESVAWHRMASSLPQKSDADLLWSGGSWSRPARGIAAIIGSTAQSGSYSSRAILGSPQTGAGSNDDEEAQTKPMPAKSSKAPRSGVRTVMVIPGSRAGYTSVPKSLKITRHRVTEIPTKPSEALTEKVSEAGDRDIRHPVTSHLSNEIASERVEAQPSLGKRGRFDREKIVLRFLRATSIVEGEIDELRADAWMATHPQHRAVVQAWLDGDDEQFQDITSPGEEAAAKCSIRLPRPKAQSAAERQKRYRERLSIRSLDLPEATYVALRRICDARGMSIDEAIRWLLSAAPAV